MKIISLINELKIIKLYNFEKDNKNNLNPWKISANYLMCYLNLLYK